MIPVIQTKVVVKKSVNIMCKLMKAAHRNMQLPEDDLEFTLNAYSLENIK